MGITTVQYWPLWNSSICDEFESMPLKQSKNKLFSISKIIFNQMSILCWRYVTVVSICKESLFHDPPTRKNVLKKFVQKYFFCTTHTPTHIHLHTPIPTPTYTHTHIYIYIYMYIYTIFKYKPVYYLSWKCQPSSVLTKGSQSSIGAVSASSVLSL